MADCNHCGRCCLKYPQLQAYSDDLKRWKDRPDIMQYVSVLIPGRLADLWLSPVTGDELKRCPFLRKKNGVEEYYCRIYDVRPDVCRDYPVSQEQADMDGCCARVSL